MNLFEKEDAYVYFRRISERVAREIETLSDEKIQTTDTEEWVEYYYSKNVVDPIVLFENNLTQDANESTVKRSNLFYGRMPYEKEYVEIPAYTVIFDIPFDGSPELLELQPSSRILSHFPASIQNPRGDSCGSMKITLQFTKEELKDKGDIPTIIRSRFNQEMDSYRKMIQYVNIDAANFNQQLRKHIDSCLKKRKDRASDFQAFKQKMDIPLVKSGTAPNTVPLPLKRIARTPPVAPSSRKLETEYQISDNDYQNINNIIDMFCIACEKAALTYSKLEEEEVRDTLLSVLNTHYENTSGETFRKKGKTDILIELENRAGFIAECKIWHGQKAFDEAIAQLFGYITWRDSKASLIVFNKHNKNFSVIRDSINEWVSLNSIRSKQKKANIWICTLKKGDSSETVDLTILIYDLFIG